MKLVTLKVRSDFLAERSLSIDELAFSLSLQTGVHVHIEPVQLSAESFPHEVSFYGISDSIDQKIMSAWDSHMGH